MDNGDQEQDEVSSFVIENIDTVPHLEALLLVWQSGSESWSATRLAARIYVDAAQAKAILEDLNRRGFIARDSADPDEYRFDPEWDRERQLVPRLAKSYSRDLIGITRLIHSKGSASVREFARAFQIKKDS
jgi:hypothetical protein